MTHSRRWTCSKPLTSLPPSSPAGEQWKCDTKHAQPIANTVNVTDDDGLDRLSSKELYDLAVAYAKRHLDVRFFWELVELLPAAEAAAGELEEAEADLMRLSAHVDDLTDAGREPIADMLRPFYIEYLRRHGVRADSGTSA